MATKLTTGTDGYKYIDKRDAPGRTKCGHQADQMASTREMDTLSHGYRCPKCGRWFKVEDEQDGVILAASWQG